jgi:hypothetical protein
MSMAIVPDVDVFLWECQNGQRVLVEDSPEFRYLLGYADEQPQPRRSLLVSAVMNMSVEGETHV